MLHFAWTLNSGASKVITSEKDGIKIAFTTSRQWLLYPGQKVTVCWNVFGAKEVYVNETAQPSINAWVNTPNSHQTYRLVAINQSGLKQTFILSTNILLLYPATWILIFLAGIALYEIFHPPPKQSSTDTAKEKAVYFPGLNGARFLAALAVLIIHVSEILGAYGIKNLEVETSSYYFSDIGYKAVGLFFCLSGFLITYLLLKEQESTSSIKIKEFYFRRVLRIWPLYYFVFLLGLFVIPNYLEIPESNPLSTNPVASFLLYLFFLPNLAEKLNLSVWIIAQLWSIGVEEQFYLFWPILLKKFKKLFLPIASTLVLIGITLDILFSLESNLQNLLAKELHNNFYFALNCISAFRMDHLAIGGIGAYLLVFHRSKLESIAFHPIVERLNIVLLVYLFLNNTRFLTFQSSIAAISVTIFLLNIASNPSSTISLENKVFSYLGRISYGIYMYHTLVICMATLLVKSTLNLNEQYLVSIASIYLLSIAGSITLAALSYRFFEKPFLKQKAKFSVIKSSNA